MGSPFYTTWKHQKTNLVFTESKQQEPIHDQCSHHTETSQLICKANHPTGFYMIGKFNVNGFSVKTVVY